MQCPGRSDWAMCDKARVKIKYRSIEPEFKKVTSSASSMKR